MDPDVTKLQTIRGKVQRWLNLVQAVRDGVQDVAVKVLAASPTEAIQMHALKKVQSPYLLAKFLRCALH